MQFHVCAQTRLHIKMSPMPPDESQSRFVRLVMPHASPSEIKDATQHWFAVLQTLDGIVSRREKEERDSRDPPADANF
jgi:hypothetical protein